VVKSTKLDLKQGAQSWCKEQQDDNKTKEIRIIQDNGIWKVINHEGRALDATRTRAEAEESVAILEQFPEYGGPWLSIAVKS
jgi:hypothetical protein